MTRRLRIACIGVATAASLLAVPTLALCDNNSPSAPAQAAAPAHSPVAGLFATTAGTDKSAAPTPTGVAAVIDGHIIPMADVVSICLREDGPSAVDRLVQRYVVDRECKRLGIVVSQDEVDCRIEDLRLFIAPMTMEEGLKAHHQTRAMLEDDIRQSIARVRLVIDRVPPTKMVHCRVLFIPFAPPGAPESVAGTRRTEAEARASVASLQKQLAAGADFAVLAKQHFEMAQANSGDVGVLYEGIHDIDTALLQAALTLRRGERSVEPIRSGNGFYLVQAIGTDSDHAAAEDGIFAEAQRTYKETRAQFLVGQGIVDLLSKSHVEYYVH